MELIGVCAEDWRSRMEPPELAVGVTVATPCVNNCVEFTGTATGM